MQPLRPAPFKHPARAVLAALAMGVGIAAFCCSVVIGRALVPVLPVEDADRVVQVARFERPGGVRPILLGDLRLLERDVGALEAVGAFRTLPVHLTGGEGPPVRLRAAEMTAGAFRALGVGPALGRPFLPEDEAFDAEPVTLLGHDVWRSHFGGATDVVGRRVAVNGRRATVVGVMPARFAFPLREELWLSLPEPRPGDAAQESTPVRGIGRLRDGVDVATARAELSGLRPGDHSFFARGWVDMLRDGDPEAEAIPTAIVGSYLLLLVACANVALLFLVRALNAEHTTALRLAMGARRATIVAERLVETLTLAAIGGAFGLACIFVWSRALLEGHREQLEYGQEIGVDPGAVLATLAAVVTAALIAGLVPALRGTDIDLARPLRERSAGGSVRLGRAARVLLLAEVAFSCVALVGIGHSYRGMRSMVRSTLEGLPFPAHELAVARYELLETRHPGADARLEVHRRVVAALAGSPRVRAVSMADALPGTVYGLGLRVRSVALEGTPASALDGSLARTATMAVAPGFFDLAGAEVLRGRDLAWEDRPEREPVAVVNASFVRRHLGGATALGARVDVGGQGWRRIVGVVSDVATERPDGRADAVYVPLSEAAYPPWVLVRPAGPALAALPDVRAAVRAEDPEAPVYQADTMEGTIMEVAWAARFLVTTFGLFGMSTLLITAVGLHGLMAFQVGRRTRELAVRSALGARAPSLAWQVLQGVTGPVLVGLALGVSLAWWVTPYLGVGLLGADPRDPLLYVVVPLAIVGSAVAAGLGPMVRAVGMEIVEGLRVE